MSTPPLSPPTADASAQRARTDVRSLVVCATPGAGEHAVAAAFAADGVVTPRAWFDIDRVAPALLDRWRVTDLDDYIAALHAHEVTPDGVFGVVLHWHELRRVHRQVAGLRQPTAQRLLDIVEVIAPAPTFLHVQRADRAAHVAALAALETDRHDQPVDVRQRTLDARIAATETVWAQWFDAIGVQPVRATAELLTTDPAARAAVVARLGPTAP